jgi:hypothetical protein
LRTLRLCEKAGGLRRVSRKGAKASLIDQLDLAPNPN